MSTRGWIILGIVNIPLYFVIGRAFFSDWEEFCESVRFWFTPDIFSWFRGEYWEDRWAEFNLAWWMATCVGCVLGEAYLIGKIMG